MTVLIQSIGKLRVGDGDQVFINERAISDTLMQHGLPAPSSATYYRVIEELIAKGFIAPSENTHLFFFNPAIFFNGDRVRFCHGNQAKEGLGARTPRAAGASRPP